jgi:AAA+ ATPase superfamily predicted ATPase
VLFDLHPKESRDELFGRDSELEFVRRQVLAGNWVVIGGQRGIGKTSLLKVALREFEGDGFRAVYVNLRGVNSLRDLLSLLVNEINRSRINLGLRVSLNFVVGSLGVSVRSGRRVMNSLLELLLSISDRTVIGLDEVQELSRVGGQFLKILGNVFASNPRVSFIFTGSYVGLMRTLLNPGPDSPLYGRPPVEVRLRPLGDDEAREFLRRGFEEAGVAFNRYDEVISRIDGIIGWLTLFGNYHAIRGLGFEDALRMTMEEGGKIMLSELEHFLEDKVNKALYIAVLQALKVVSRWSEIKSAVSAILGVEVGDRELVNALNSLVGYNFVERRGRGEYGIADPILRQVDMVPLLRRYLRSGTSV